MQLFHDDLLKVLYGSYYQTKKLVDDIRGLYDIDHFSLDIVDPRGKMLFFSSTPAHGFEICSRGYGEYDGIISPRYYKFYEFYWWKEASHKKYAHKIEQIRKKVLGLQDGFMLVRKWNDFYIIYSFAARKKHNDFQSKVVNNLNKFLEIGDYIYTNLRNEYAKYCVNFEPPIIEKFYPFIGGIPIARYTQNFSKTSKNNVIFADFRTKVKTNCD